ncbi:MAG: hypothetical protein NZM38_11340 [Cytophagales bacterium]|nr:hypothetical protein [Cytophagales bacterium]MDW8385350.1 hypothetical protein [Flammeovirgaceae bacterium]
MLPSELIFFHQVPPSHFQKMVRQAAEYAILSIPFTFNRMGIESISKKILNIAKGKVAEYMFRYFCFQSDIQVDFESCQTPFYQPDRRDFLWNGKEWDIKNNFLYYSKEFLNPESYLKLPALIPNQHENDQWQKRLTSYFQLPVAFLFTFLKNGNRYGENFMEIFVSSRQLKILHHFYRQYQGKAQLLPPFKEKEFWNEFSTFQIEISHQPTLVITGYATQQEWSLFRDSGNGIRFYGEGVLKTVINNRFCWIEQLPSFRSMIQKLGSD